MANYDITTNVASNANGPSAGQAFVVDSNGTIFLFWKSDTGIRWAYSDDRLATYSGEEDCITGATLIKPKVCIGDDDKIYIIYGEESGGLSKIWFRIYDGSWGDATQVDDETGYKCIDWSIAIGESNEVRVVYSTDDTSASSKDEIKTRAYTGTWDSVETLSTLATEDQKTPMICCGPSGYWHAVWTGRITGQIAEDGIYYKRDTGSWGSVETVEYDSGQGLKDSAIAVHNDGVVSVCWTYDDDTTLQINERNGSWGSPQTIHSGGNGQSTPSMAIGSTGQISILYLYKPAAVWEIRYARGTFGPAWTFWDVTSGSSNDNAYPMLLWGYYPKVIEGDYTAGVRTNIPSLNSNCTGGYWLRDDGGGSYTLRAYASSSFRVAAQYYVKTTGDNADDGRTEDTAWETATYARATVRAGDRVTFLAGTYHDWIDTPYDGQVEHPILWKAKDNDTVVLDGSDIETGWSKTGGYNYVYQITPGYGVEYVWEDDENYSYSSESSIANVDANAGSFRYTGGVLYVRCLDDADPDTHTMYVQRRDFCYAPQGGNYSEIYRIQGTHSKNAFWWTGAPDARGNTLTAYKNGNNGFRNEINNLVLDEFSSIHTGGPGLETVFGTGSVMGNGELSYCTGVNGYGANLGWLAGTITLDTVHIHHCDQHGVKVDGQFYTIQNCEIHDNSLHGIYMYNLFGMSTNKILSTVLYNNTQNGLYAQNQTSNFQAKHNIAYNNGWSGLYFRNADGALIENNLVYDHGGAGIYLDNSCTSNSVRNNTCVDNRGGGALYIITNSVNNTATDNTFVITGVDNQNYTIDASSQSGITLDNNNLRQTDSADCGVWGGVRYSTLGDWQTATSQEANSFDTDPLFVVVSNGDYYLNLGSPCIDAGSRTASAASLDDRYPTVVNAVDSGTVDVGYHYPTAASVHQLPRRVGRFEMPPEFHNIVIARRTGGSYVLPPDPQKVLNLVALAGERLQLTVTGGVSGESGTAWVIVDSDRRS